MEFLKEHLSPKCFSVFGYAVACVQLFAGLTFVTITGKLRAEEKSQFRCYIDKGLSLVLDDVFVKNECYLRYERLYNHALPFYGFVILSFGVTLTVCVVYSLCIKSRVEEIEKGFEKMKDNIALEKNTSRTIRRGVRSVLVSYILHLVIRFLLGLLFTVLQNKVLYPLNFPSQFRCSLPRSSASKQQSSIKEDRVPIINCRDSVGAEKTLWARMVLIANITFAVLVLAEVKCLVLRLWRLSGKKLANDLEFCRLYFIRKITIDCPTVVDIVTAIETYKRHLLSNTIGTLDSQYVNVIIHRDRATEEFIKTRTRCDMFDMHLKPPAQSERIDDMINLFLPDVDAKETAPHTILVVGRPGIGKSMLSIKILREYATSCTHEFYNGKIVILLKFIWFNTERFQKISLKKLLQLATTQWDEATFQSIFLEVLQDPSKLIIIFDGLDEYQLGGISSFLEEETLADDPDKEMPALILFIKLVLGKLLNGATIFTTTRPTVNARYFMLGWQRRVEIVGFTRDKIEDYVRKFCQINQPDDPGMFEKMWTHIKTLPELLNLCYIPVNCDIICRVLMKNLATGKNTPTTLTELYDLAIRHLVSDHQTDYKGDTNNFEQLDDPLSVLKDLESLAFRGVSEGRLIFDKEVKHDMAKSCLLNSLPNNIKEIKPLFSFIHLTIQEFLAARHVVETKSPPEINEFISSRRLDEGSTWHLVIQFIFGCLGEKIKAGNSDADYRLCVASLIDRLPTSLSWDGWVSEEKTRGVIFIMKCLRELKDDDLTKKAASDLSDPKVRLIWYKIPEADCGAVMSFLKHIKALKILILDSYHMSERFCFQLTKFLQEKCLEQLSMDRCKIDDPRLEEIVTAMSLENATRADHKHFNLTLLSLNYNRISSRGVSILSHALKTKFCHVTWLLLGGNQIDDDGVLALCDVLVNDRCNLKVLWLSENRVSEVGVSLLFEALISDHCCLTQLDVVANNISVKGKEQLKKLQNHYICKRRNVRIYY